MEVFIRDEEKDYIFIGYKKNKKYQVGLDMETRVDPITKSLDQHDNEVRAEERKKVVAELQEWNNKLIDEGYIIDYEDLEQKLKELNGE